MKKSQIRNTLGRLAAFCVLLTLPVSWSIHANTTAPETSTVSRDNLPYTTVLEQPVSDPNRTIVYGDSDSQFINVYESKEAKGIIAFVHGGCWLSQFDIQHSNALATALNAEGYEVWNIEYRRSGNGGEWPIALEDISKAIELLNERSDLPKFLLGHSAGGHLAMRYAVDNPSSFNAVFGLAPIVDVINYGQGQNSCQKASPLFLGGEYAERLVEYEQADVASKIFDEKLPIFVMTGGSDTIVPVNYSAHSQATVINLQAAGHFDWIHPQSNAYARLIQEIQQLL